MDLLELTRELIGISSVTGNEAEASRFLARYLASLNYHVEVQEAEPGRANIFATASLTAPIVVLSTHMDTVPPHIPFSEDDEYLYGRGACDTKGIIAAQIAAAERLRASGVAEIGLLFVVDEEVGSTGARLANKHPAASGCRYLINGEPTDNRLAIGSKGSLRVRLKTLGQAAHSAYPERGESAIEKLLDVLADVRRCQWPSDGFFGETTCNIGRIAGGTASNVIPAEAYADLHIRLVTNAASVESLLERVVAGRALVEYLSTADPVRMLAVDGFEQCVVRFTTDIPHLTNWGTPLLLGPGSILDAHTTGERVAKRDLVEAVTLYINLVRALLARNQCVGHAQVQAGQ